MLPSSFSAIVDSHDEYAVAEALGSPLPAPSRSYVYIVTVEKDYATVFLQAAASSIEEAERLATEYVISNVSKLFQYSSHWLPVNCSTCESTVAAPMELDWFATVYRSIYRERQAILAGRVVEPHEAGTVFPLICQNYSRHRGAGSSLTLDLAADTSRYLYAFPAVQRMMRNVQGCITIAKAIVDEAENSEIIER